MPLGHPGVAHIDGPPRVPASLLVGRVASDEAPGAAAGWVHTEYQSIHNQATADANGRAEVVFRHVPGMSRWLLERLVVSSDSVAAGSARVYSGAEDPVNLIDVTAGGSEDVGEYWPPVLLQAGDALRVVWTGLSAGARATARAQYRVELEAG